ncbi:MAG: hypothetical protein K940chlam7_00062 [Chlamydiae bacterium]|nr:hypothetical protein [Chlamydiota bacterium]
MGKELQSMSQEVGGIHTRMESVGFESSEGEVRLIPGKVHTISKQEPLPNHLTNCFVAWVNHVPIIRSGSIDSDDKAHEFVALARKVNQERTNSSSTQLFRVCSHQLNSVEFEWDLIRFQHQRLSQISRAMQKGEKIVHLTADLRNFYTIRPNERKLQSDEEALGKLPKLLNMAAWADYCAWYNDLLEEAFSNFLCDAVDEYTLERYIKDFRHEVFSLFLKRTREQLLELELQVGTLEKAMKAPYRDVVATEKRLIQARSDMQRMVRAHYDSLTEILRIIKIVGDAHPELYPLMNIGKVLKELLANQVEVPGVKSINWAVNEMHLQILNEDFGVISALNCDNGIDRTNLAFAIRLAVSQLKQEFSREEVGEMLEHWEEITRAVNKKVTNGGEGETPQRLAQMVIRYRERFCGNLVNFCIPITELNTSGGMPQRQERLYEHQIPLNFFPSHFSFPNEAGEPERVPLVNYDSETGTPTELTDAGHRLMMSVCYS